MAKNKSKVRVKKPLRLIISMVALFTASALIYAAAPFVKVFFVHSEGVRNFVLCGVDEGGYRTDMLMVAQYNFDRKSVTVLQIPRDTYVSKSLDHKINSAYGTKDKEKTMFAAVKEVTGIEADKFATVSFEGFRKIIDEIGGVEIDVPFRMKYDDPYQDLHIDLEPGVQVLSGAKAEQFVRWRKNNSGMASPGGGGDLVRVESQSEFMRVVAKKVLAFPNILKAPKLLSIAMDNITTNFTEDELTVLIGKALRTKPDNITILQLPGEPKMINGGSYFIHDSRAAKELVEENFEI